MARHLTKYALLTTRPGHTLAELMVVMAILVMFAVIVAPRVLTSLYPAKLDSAMQAVRGDLDFARARAAGTGLRHQLVISEAGELVVGPVRMTVDTNQTVSDVPETALRDRLPEDVSVSEWTVTPLASGEAGTLVTGTADVLTFYPEGVSDSARLVLQDSTGNRRGLELNGYTGELRELTPEEMPAR